MSQFICFQQLGNTSTTLKTQNSGGDCSEDAQAFQKFKLKKTKTAEKMVACK